MATSTKSEVTESAPEPERTELYAFYIGSSDARILTSEELSKLGVTHKEDLRWDKSNGKAVQLSKTNVAALVKALPREFIEV